ncbi:MAG: hypothetical protein NXI32_00440 [bacterium]|nr:hypothetical protein [bacterium]
MTSSQIFRVNYCWSLLWLLASGVCEAQVQEGFRIETDIFLEGKVEPLSQTLTLFQDGIAYDIPRQEGQEITMVDPGNDRIIRFNQTSAIRTTVAISHLRKMLDSAKAQAQNTGLAMFLAGSQKIEADSKRVIVGDDLLRYEATMQQPPLLESAPANAKTYREFADAVKLLSSFDGMDPPFARLALNAAIHEQNSIPEEIRLSVNNGKGQVVYISRLHTTWMLSKNDKKRISEIQKMLVTFEDLGPAEYKKRNEESRIASKPK